MSTAPAPSPAVLSKTVTVLDLDPVDLDDQGRPEGGYVAYLYPQDHDAVDAYASRTLTLDWQTWDDLGRPAQITVTIQPGDHLNTDQEDRA